MTIQETHLFHQLPCPLPDGYREEDVLFLDLETQAFGRADRPIPVSYTHLTLPTTPYV